MMKRDANSAWPANPMASQIRSGVIQPFILTLRHFDGVAKALLEPQHAENVLYADNESVPDAVFRFSMHPAAMSHFDKPHIIAFPQHERRKITMHMVEIGKCQIRVAPEGFQATAGIRGAVVEHPAAQSVGEERHDPLSDGIAPLHPDAGNHPDSRCAIFGMK